MAKLKRDKLFRHLEAHKQFMTPAERATHKRKRDARKKRNKRMAANLNKHVQAILPDSGLAAVDVEDLTSPLPAETMADVVEGGRK